MRGAAIIFLAAGLAACVPPPIRRGADTPPPVADPAPADLTDERVPPPRLLPPRPPAAPPSWEVRPVTPDARDVAAQLYVVQPGDTLRAIANATGAGSEAIARENGLVAPFIVRAGERLRIPAGRYHLVRAGETGIAIARAYGVPWNQVVEANSLSEPYILRLGQRIVIPRGGTVPARGGVPQLTLEDIITGGRTAQAELPRPDLPPPDAAAPEGPPPSGLPSAGDVGRFTWPVNGRVIRRFGPAGAGERLNGVKIAVPLRTPVLAAADGEVLYTGSDVPGLGGLVMLGHAGDWRTIYAHNGDILVRPGQRVRRGQAVALSGDSGFVDQPELHFEVRRGRSPVDPLTLLPPR